MELILIGAGGMCKEVISLIEDINRRRAVFEITGILDDDPALAGISFCGYPVLGKIRPEGVPDGSLAALCIATHRDIALRSRVGGRLNLAPERWAKIIHPQATVAADAILSPGVILYPGTRVAASAKIGLNAFLYYNAVLHHDSTLGDYTQVCAGVMIAGRSSIGSRCYLGIGCSVRDGVKIGDDVMVGMGAVVTGDLTEAGKVYRGIPARCD